MSPIALKIGIVVCVLGMVVCAFVAVERYQSNAAAVEAANQMWNESPVPNLFGAEPVKMEPATPTATKYAIFIGLLFLAGGVTCAILLGRHASRNRSAASRSGPRRKQASAADESEQRAPVDALHELAEEQDPQRAGDSQQ